MCTSNVTNYTNLPAGTNPQEVKFDRHSSAADPRLFVVGQNNSLVWLDVTSAPGTQLRVIAFGGAVHHVNDSSVSPYMWLTFGANHFNQYTVNEGAMTLTVTTSISTLVNPKGFGLEGSGNDILLANSGAGQILALNPSTLGADAAVNVGGTPDKVSGPNGPTPSCALAADSTNNRVEAISVGATPALGTAQIGTTLSVPGSPVSAAFFPPGTPGSGTIGIGSTTGIVALAAGGAQLYTCTGSSFASSTFWQTFPTNPAAMVTSVYASTAVSSLVYVTGLDNGVPSLQAFTAGYDHNLGSLTLTGTSTPNPTDVTAGP